MVATRKPYSVDDLLSIPNGENFELWHGELVEVSPSSINSSAIALRIAVQISLFVELNDLGVVSGENGGYVLFPNRDTVVAPDVGFVRWERLVDRRLPNSFCGVSPDLAVEVTSPSDEPGEMKGKLALYMDAGVPLVWWAHPEAKQSRFIGQESRWKPFGFATFSTVKMYCRGFSWPSRTFLRV